MIGPITDSCALFVGGLAGTLFSGFIPKRVKETLPLIFGVITLCMGSTLVNKASALPVVVMALIVGSVIGELVFAESFLAKCIRALFRLAKSKHCGNEKCWHRHAFHMRPLFRLLTRPLGHVAISLAVSVLVKTAVSVSLHKFHVIESRCLRRGRRA